MNRTAHTFYSLLVAAFILMTTGCSSANTKQDVDADTQSLFLKIEQLAPAKVYVERQECRGPQIVAVGIADNIAVVSRYMRTIAEAGLNPELRFIKPNGYFALAVRDKERERVLCNKPVSYNSAEHLKDKRTQADIQKVFEANKERLYGIYNAALRENPNLQGKIVVKFTILPSGGIIRLRLVSSSLSNRNFELRFLNELDAIEFGAQNSPAVTIIYPIVFVPTHRRDI